MTSTLLELLERQPVPIPWAEGDNIPWNAPDFSERMLKEHLSQSHDLASRRAERIKQHISWIHRELLREHQAKVLDLGCGPGLYCERLARLGHTCVGVDFSPASLRHARESAAQNGLNCTYLEGDLRTVAYGSGFDLAMQIFGEINVFRPADADVILRHCARALKPGGALLLEIMTFEGVEAFGTQSSGWSTVPSGLFWPQPHLLLYESFWDASSAMATRRYIVVDAASGNVTTYAQSMKAYTVDAFTALLEGTGFSDVHVSDGLGKSEGFMTFRATHSRSC